jgi:pimeloyl-ACP methyl ester carboxylesterase
MEERIMGYRQRGISYRRQHIESLVTREFTSSDLGQYLISLFLETNRTTDVKSIVHIFEALGEHDVTTMLHEIKVPTLIISGEEDSALPRARELNKAIGGSQHAIIKGAGHACALEKPWEFDALVLGFLTGKA